MSSKRLGPDPIVDGKGVDGVQEVTDEVSERAANLPQPTQARWHRWTAPGCARRCSSSARSWSWSNAQATTRCCGSRPTPPTCTRRLLQKVQERGTTLETQLLFFELEWAALDDAQAEAVLSSGVDLEFCAHYLRSARRYRPHLLSEPEERILAEKSLASSASWARLFGEVVSAIRVDRDGTEVPLDLALSDLLSPERARRASTAEAVTAALQPGLRTRAFIFNTLVYDKSVDDRLRSYPHWLAARNLSNEASDESVMALIQAVHGRYDIPQRWYRLKARLMGVDKLRDRLRPQRHACHQRAPVLLRGMRATSWSDVMRTSWPRPARSRSGSSDELDRRARS